MGRLVVVVSGVVKREVTSNHQAACQDAKAFDRSCRKCLKLHNFNSPGHALRVRRQWLEQLRLSECLSCQRHWTGFLPARLR
jgi:hypothetical protein